MNSLNDCIDETVYGELKLIMKDKFHQFLDVYIKSMDEYLSKGAQALAEEDFEELASNVHPIKSTSYALGAVALAENAEKIHSMIEAHREKKIDIDKQKLIIIYNSLVEDYRSVKEVLKEELERAA